MIALTVSRRSSWARVELVARIELWVRVRALG